MFIFDTNTRIEKVAEGIRFYEPDIFCVNYLLGGDQIIDVELDYKAPGFGLVVAEKNGDTIFESRMMYLFKLGDGDFRVFQKRGTIQEELKVESADISPSLDRGPVTVRFQLKGDRVTVHKVLQKNGDALSLLGVCNLPFKLSNYFVGFYSNAGNVFRDVKVHGKVPENWHVNAANIDGGRIRLLRDAFVFENCLHEAEMEQDKVSLKKGKYYLKYEADPVNSKFDIEAYVIPSNSVPAQDEDGQEDDVKSILKDGMFELTEDTDVNLKFKGHSGMISKILLTDIRDSTFVETGDSAKSKQGSSIEILVKGLKSVTWEATITHTPKDVLKDGVTSYAIAETSSKSYTLAGTRIRLDERFRYSYDVKSGYLSIDSMETTASNRLLLEMSEEDNNILRIMRNVSAYIYSFEIVRENDSVTDLVVQQTSKKYVPSSIRGPIIVTDENNAVLDISSSYREVVVPAKAYACYSMGEIVLPEALPTHVADIKVYGVPRGVRVNMQKAKIDEIASSYELIPESQYTKSAKVVNVVEAERKKYAYIIVEYLSVQDYVYETTNDEREIFDGKMDVLGLTRMPISTNAHIVIYGIKKDSYINEDMIRRVPMGIMNSIDYYAEEYDIITTKSYSIDFDNASIALDHSLQDKYQKYVVDYLKEESCAINYREDMGQYEVDISSVSKNLLAHYDLSDGGASLSAKVTKIEPSKDKYIILRERG